MKKITFKSIFLLATVAACFSGFSQQKVALKKNTGVEFTQALSKANKGPGGTVRCATREMRLANLRASIGMTDQAFEDWLEPKIEEVKQMRQQGKMGVVTIPVVVHVVHNGDAIGTNENIADGQVLSQIQIYNEDFRKQTGTPGDGAGVDTMIEFCLAQVDPSGNPTTGIVRHNLGQASWDSAAVQGTLKPNTIWDPTKYLNMWTANFGGDLASTLGYAQFPTGSGLAGMPPQDCDEANFSASTDGVIARYDTFGSRTIFPGGNYGGTQYDKGRTMTHEVGHMLGLRHLWGDGDCNVDDSCPDTPNCDGQFYANSSPGPTQCGNVRQVENYMDYSDDVIMNIFTQQQADRMMAVLLNSPRRDDLLISQVCNALVPYVEFKKRDCEDRYITTIRETTDCNFTEYTIPLSIETSDSADAIVTFSIDGASTANAQDIEFITPTVTFLSGSTTDQNLVLRVFNDGLVEGDEELIITFTVSGSGSAIANTKGNKMTFSIIDNDYANGLSRTTIFSDGFESYDAFSIADTDLSGWTMNDGDSNFHYGDGAVDFLNEGYVGTFIVFNPSQTYPAAVANWNPRTGDQGLYCFAATVNNSPSGTDTALNDDHIFTPQIQLTGTNSELRFWARTLDNTWGLERFNVKVSTTDTNVASFTTIQPNSGSVTPYHQAPVAWIEYVYDLSAYDGQNVYIAIHNVSANSYVFMVDDFSVTTELAVQTVVNTGSADQLTLKGAGTVYTKDTTNGNAMLDIQNNDSFNYGCITASVNRAGTSAQAYGGSSSPNLVTDKVFRIAATNTTNSGSSTIDFYFTEAELAGWEAATGSSRSSLYINRDVSSSTIETVVATITAFGTAGHKVSGSFTGVDGDFFFGTQVTLPVKPNEFSFFNIYPNPTNQYLNISIGTNKDVQLSLFDIRGRKIFTQLEKNTASTFEKRLSLDRMSSGIYMLIVESDDKKVTKKIVIE